MINSPGRILCVVTIALLCVVRTEVAAAAGPVVGWSNAGPPDAVNGVSGTAVDVAAGGSSSCAIQAGSGNVVCWGYDGVGQATPPDAVNGVSGTATAIAAGAIRS
jgi:hypothetical protein